jgi:hypothetical protein
VTEDERGEPVTFDEVFDGRSINAPRRPAGPPEPPDPFSVGHVAGAALHEMFLDFTGAGFTEDQALTILARMLAAYGAMDKDQP